MIRIVLVLVAIGVCIQAGAQRKSDSNMKVLKAPAATICYASGKDEFTTIGPPRSRQASGRTQSANINVTYENFTKEAQLAFQEAVEIWESLLDSDVEINVHAQWAPLGAGVLGSAGPATYIQNFDGAPKQDVWYPIVIAERITGRDLNSPDDADIVATFNSNNSMWHYGLTGSEPTAAKYDLMSIVLHEIGHGLGITHGYTVSGNQGVIPGYFEGHPVVYETNIADGEERNLVNDFEAPSEELKRAMTSNGGNTSSLFYSSTLVRSANSNKNATIYAPGQYDPGSSIAHLDENKYPSGNPNSLMTPFIGSSERMLNPGPIVMAILGEIGWTYTKLEHTALRDSEDTDGPYHAVVKVESSNGYDAGSVKLNYKTDGSFTELAMNPTGNPDEFAIDLPAGGDSYAYFISVNDVDDRTFTNPGVIIEPGSDPEQGVINFDVGPDHELPVISHTPKEFITTTEDLELQAIVSDNLGIDNVKVEWKLNGDEQPDEFMALVPDTDSTYALTVTFVTPLENGDKIEYRIRAEDASVAGNVAFKPSASTYYEMNVVGLGETQDSYFNDFNTLSGEDLFGNGFTVSKPEGFDDGAIHTDHPYAEGGADGAHVDLVYNLKIPVRVAAENAVLKFDEIVLVEPGEPNVAWPDEDFFDYVVVEGSKDGGLTWTPLADGYDSRTNSDWLSEWNSSSSGNNSTGVGDPSLYRTHSFDLLDNFEVGDEVAFRFRLYSDPFSAGWGWSIDNLKIQVDDIPPVVRHQHFDFILEGTEFVDITLTATDPGGIGHIDITYNGNTIEVPVNPFETQYTARIDLASLDLQAGEVFQYQIAVTDNNNNVGHFPAAGSIKAAIVSFSSSVDQVVADFTEESPDLTGNFFNIEQPSLFSSAGFATTHPYDTAYDISFLTKTPVKVNSDNALIFYKDIALVEYEGETVKDYVVVEASKDGVNWTALSGPYAANSVASWKSAFDAGGNPAPGFYTSHVVSITEGGSFAAGDVILVRFRLHSDAETTAWGWIVDDVSIQGSITAVEPSASMTIEAWPNPATSGSINVKMDLPAASQVSVEFLTAQGQVLSNDQFSAPAGDFNRSYEISGWSNGLYIVRLRSDFGTAIKKIVRLNSQN